MKKNLRKQIENCEACGGTGIIKTDNLVYHCSECTEIRNKLQKYKKARIPERFFNYEYEDISPNIYVKLDTLTDKSIELSYRDLYSKYTNNIDHFYKKGNGLYMFGPNGSGKSTIAFLIAKYILDNTQFSVLCFNHLSMLKDFQRIWNTENQALKKQEFIKNFKETDFLIIDDFLYQEHNSNWARELTSEMIKIRDDNNKPIIFTSNYSLNDIATKLDGSKPTQNAVSILSKIFGTIDSIIKFDDQNFRVKKMGEESILIK